MAVFHFQLKKEKVLIFSPIRSEGLHTLQNEKRSWTPSSKMF